MGISPHEATAPVAGWEVGFQPQIKLWALWTGCSLELCFCLWIRWHHYHVVILPSLGDYLLLATMDDFEGGIC